MSGAQGRLTLWMIEIFAAIAETRAISGAAKRVGASPSAVSQQLSKLEDGVGVILVDRAARPLRLTPQGEIFLRRAQVILDEAALARSELLGRDLSHLTRVRLGMIEDFDADVTPRLLTDMSCELRACQFLLETGPSHRLLTGLAERSLDMVVAADSAAPIEGLEIHPLLSEPFIAVVPLVAGKPVATSAQALREVPFIQYTQRHHMGRQIAAHLARQDFVLSPRFEMDSYHAILSMVAEGAGWSILTPLGLLRAHRFEARVGVIPLPIAPFARAMSLWALRGGLGDMPAQTAARLRPILTDLIVGPALQRMPWLGEGLVVLGADGKAID
ncbi:LysR family transcriptional regulator [Meridianimarinicoccus aquatilis]|uniref:LysR family transcriptional regulator n=1 Tax=Meridianimarinicoccus aquatilis TaxID=2552766 RepID=A0A4R6B333_9RHOB|nr:LysR family transcriptional regulator [Fluviibacterium aquatile]QIE41996.1 LysR family transcriptional regulator [Rhodobacteraceae bacterium SC52]TDL90692.1 LysR family transcriptional regulator [Fluviibacterium aquatile]